MPKIHTVEALDNEIDAEIAWRKQELTTALKLVQQSAGPAHDANLRAGVLLLYAHWEGWVKAVAKLYIRYVNTKAYPYDALSEAFLGNALKTRLESIEEATSSAVHNNFAAFLRSDLSKNASLSEGLVRTESNLSSSVLLEIIERLGLEKRDRYTLRAQMLDRDLVHARNSIAHGQYMALKVEDFRTLRSNTIELLSIFTDDVRNAASTGRHLAAPSPQI